MPVAGTDAHLPADRRLGIGRHAGGIAASVTAFVLEMLGHPQWSLYDNSLLEWSANPELPIELRGAP